MTRFALPAALLLAAFGFVTSGCRPSIGDKCVLSTDCSLRGDRMCDTSQPGGYCTIKDCRTNGCPDDGACVLFAPSVPGCGFDDRTPSRASRPYCMAACQIDSDCRGGDYICADPKAAPWSAIVLDVDTGKRVCIIRPSATAMASDGGPTSAPVCSPFVDAGTIDAQSVYDSGAADGGSDAAAATDAGADAGSFDAAEGG